MIRADILENGTILTYEKTVSDSVRFETVKFAFPQSWAGLTKTAVFKNGDTAVSIILDTSSAYCLSEDECYIPFEVLQAPEFTISVFGTKDDTLATTARGVVTVLESGYEHGDTPAEPTASEYSQIIDLVNNATEIAQSVRDDADNGVFKGDKGDTGAKGEKGNQGEQGIQGPKGDKGEKGDKGDQGEQGLQGEKGDKGDKGDQGEQGIQGATGPSGLLPRQSSPYYQEVSVPANTMINYNELTGDFNVSLQNGISGYDNEWDFTITQGDTAYNVILPTVYWGFGIAPAFPANTTTLCRLYYIGNTLCGEWVSI
ncbi:MAG: collagen-like protein [Clostridia bacterium]|nr:collagen-like protein [Clostridia bacterium]